MTQNPKPLPSASQLHKALPPRSFAAPPEMVAGTLLACRVTFDQRNGVPHKAVLVPVENFEGRWKIRQGGRLVDLPELRSIDDETVEVQLCDDRQAVTATLPWPGNARRALLLLLHPQVTIGGDMEYDEIADHREPVALESGVVTRRIDQAPAPGRGASFALGSCQYPAGMLDATVRVRTRALDDRYIGPAERSLWRLGERLESDPSIRFTVLTGDQVYVDRTAGLFDPSKLLERLSFAYGAFLLNAGLQRVLRVAGAEIFPMLDDHEVADNWEPRPRGYGHDELQDAMAEGRRLYVTRQRSMWPKAVRDTVSDKRLWLAAQLHGHPFFFADSRSKRQGRTIGNLAYASILRKPQSAELHKWIRTQGPDSPPGFVVSASILLPRYLSMRGRPRSRNPLGLALQTDSWAGYPRSLHKLLACVYDANAQHVVFLSGDEHLSCIATITIECMSEARKVVVHSIHSSALYAPYTFANASIDDFAADETFEFIDEQKHAGRTRKFRCHVKTFFPDSGDGFAILRPYQSVQGAWHLDVEFDGARRKVMRTIDFA